MLNFSEVFNALKLGGVAVYPLLLLGILMTMIILDRVIVYVRYTKLPQSLLDPDLSWEKINEGIKDLPKDNVYLKFIKVIERNRDKPIWWTEARANDCAQLIEKELNRGQWILETIVTAAPLIGLLGTIIGMMSSFKVIGAHGLVKPEQVTGGVAEALIATALGLFIALITLFAFNYFSRHNNEVIDQLERIGSRLIDLIRIEHAK